MTATEFQSHLAAAEAGDAARSVIEGRISEILKIARDIRMARPDWMRAVEFTAWGSKDTLFHCYRGSVDSVSLDNPLTIYFRVADYFRGETDYECYSFPREWMTMSNEEVKAALTAQLNGLLAKVEERGRAKAAKAEAEQRAEFERLKVKFDGAIS